MKSTTLLVYIFISLATFMAIIELLHPAPKISDYCNQQSCRMEAIDRLVGTSEDYRGGLISFFIGCFLVALVVVITSLITPYPHQLIMIGTILMVDSVVYTIMMRFVAPFSRWPVQTWIFIVAVLLTFGLILSYPFKKHSA